MVLHSSEQERIMADWKSDYNPHEVAKALEKAKSVDKNGKVRFQGFAYYDYAVVLNSMVSLNKEIPLLEKRRVISKAISQAGAKGKITTERLLSEIRNLESKYLRRPLQRYNLVTSISVNRLCNLKRKKVCGCTISFCPFLPKIYGEGISKIIQHARHSITGEVPTNYMYVKVSVSAKSYDEAANKALDALDLIRGIWNFFENRKHGMRISSGKRNPVNKYILGPLHTLHKPNGKLATESWWYDLEYVYQIRPYDPSRVIGKLYKFESSVRKLIQKSKYSSDIDTAILRYTRALDLTNWEDAFLRLWSVLEHLTGTSPSDKYKVTVRRAAFVFGGEKYARQVLTHLRDYRNRAVHSGSENHDIGAYMYQLKRFVEALMEFHLGNKYGFKSLADASRVLDLPCDRQELRKKRKTLAYAERFLGYK